MERERQHHKHRKAKKQPEIDQIEFFKPGTVKHIYNDQTTFIEVPYEKVTREQLEAVSEYVDDKIHHVIRIPMWDSEHNTYFDEIEEARKKKAKNEKDNDVGVGWV